MPIQPFVEASTISYQKKLTRLNPFVEKEGGMFYQFQTPEVARPFKIPFVPDGCVNLLFSCDEKNQQTIVSGIFDQMYSMELKPKTQYFGVIPYSGFLGVKSWKALPSELHENQYDLMDVIGDAYLCEMIAGLGSFEERIHFFREYFLKNMADKDYSYTLAGALSITTCCASGNISVEQIGDWSGYSYSYCRKSFIDRFGVSVKRYSQKIRFSQAMALLLQNGDDHNLVDIALKTGFYDEPHFIHEFKKFTGYTPRKFLNHIFALRKERDSATAGKYGGLQ
jgi:AraC-like DNA-binding protein